MVNDLISKIYLEKQKKAELESQIDALKAQLTAVDTNIDALSSDLLGEMKTMEIKTTEVDNLVAEVFSKENIGYTSDKDVLDYLKANYNGQYIKTKITESLDKTPLKKAIKSDSVLAKALEDMTVRTLTEYVVVTTKENHQRMLEHIEAGK